MKTKNILNKDVYFNKTLVNGAYWIRESKENFFLDLAVDVQKNLKTTSLYNCRRRLEGHPLRIRHKQDWARGFILLQLQAAVMSGSNTGSDGVVPALVCFIKNRHTHVVPDV